MAAAVGNSIRDVDLVPFRFDLRGYDFQQRVKSLQQAYRSASGAILLEIIKTKNEAQDYQDGVSAGAARVGEWDSEGYPIWEQSQLLDLQVEAYEEGLSSLRKAFVISLYHHWERGVRAWTKSDANTRHDDLVEAAIASGLQPAKEIDAIRDLVNLLKHDNERWATSLKQTWPDVLDVSSRRRRDRSSWYDAVQLTDDHVETAFSVVISSGPDHKS